MTRSWPPAAKRRTQAVGAFRNRGLVVHGAEPILHGESRLAQRDQAQRYLARQLLHDVHIEVRCTGVQLAGQWSRVHVVDALRPAGGDDHMAGRRVRPLPG